MVRVRIRFRVRIRVVRLRVRVRISVSEMPDLCISLWPLNGPSSALSRSRRTNASIHEATESLSALLVVRFRVIGG